MSQLCPASLYPGTFDVPLEDLVFDEKHNPRREFSNEEIDSLALSIKSYGLRQPIKVSKQNGKWVIDDGQRRVRALRKLRETTKEEKYATITAFTFAKGDPDPLLGSLIDLIHRQDLTPVDQSLAITKILEDNKLAPVELANIFGKEKKWVLDHVKVAQTSKDIEKPLLDKVGTNFQTSTFVRAGNASTQMSKEKKQAFFEALMSLPPVTAKKAVKIATESPELSVDQIVDKAKTTRGGGLVTIEIQISQVNYDRATKMKSPKTTIEKWLSGFVGLALQTSDLMTSMEG